MNKAMVTIVGHGACAVFSGRDEVLVEQRKRGRELMARLEALPVSQQKEREDVMKQLFKKVEEV
jgi:hypothetical protein